MSGLVISSRLTWVSMATGFFWVIQTTSRSQYTVWLQRGAGTPELGFTDPGRLLLLGHPTLPGHIHTLGFIGALQFTKHYSHFTRNLPVGGSAQVLPACVQGPSGPSTQNSELGGQISHFPLPNTLTFPRFHCRRHTFPLSWVQRQSL